jgi:alpha-L-fucosidase 2
MILVIDEQWRTGLIDKPVRLMRTPSGSDGRIMEWPEEYAESDPHHRHIAHLWGLYPGNEISPDISPELAKAARKTLDGRGDEGVGWSLAYKAVLWARLGDGNRAWAILRSELNPVATHEMRYDNGGGIYPNLFDASPPFQIDGNFGATAAIGEMLVQSQNGVIRLLPALPDDWREGQVSGLRARGGFVVSMKWKDGRLTQATIRSESGEPCRIRYRDKTADLRIKKGKSVSLNSLLN